MLNPVEQSLGGASDVHRGVWIQALTLLGQRELVRTAANISPASMQCRRAFRTVRGAVAAGWLYSHTVKLAKATIPPIVIATTTSTVATVSRVIPGSLPL